MKSFKEFKSQVSEGMDDGVHRLQDKDIEFDIDNIDVETVYDKDVDVFMDEDALGQIKDIVKNSSAKAVKFADGKSMKVDMQTANVLLKVLDALNDTNKKKFGDMLGKNKANFMKAVDFAWGAVK